MPQYGEIRVDYITYTTGVSPEANRTVTVSSLVNNPVFSGDVIIDGGGTISGDLGVSGNTILNDITVTGDGYFGGDATVSGRFTVTGLTTLNDLTVTGDLNASNITITGDTNLSRVILDQGSSGTPSLTFTGDLDTGIYSEGAGRINFTNNGVHTFEIDEAGRMTLGGPDANDQRSYLTLDGPFATAGSNLTAFKNQATYNRSDSSGINGGASSFISSPVIEAEHDYFKHFYALTATTTGTAFINNQWGFNCNNLQGAPSLSGSAIAFITTMQASSNNNKFAFYASGDAPSAFNGPIWIQTDVGASTKMSGQTDFHLGSTLSYIKGQTKGIIADDSNNVRFVLAAGASNVADLEFRSTDATAGEAFIRHNASKNLVFAVGNDEEIMYLRGGSTTRFVVIGQSWAPNTSQFGSLALQVETAGHFAIPRPSNMPELSGGVYWSQNTGFYAIAGSTGSGNVTSRYGQVDTHGAFNVNITSNGCRTTSGWYSYAVNSTSGASQISLDPQGFIVLRGEQSKINGESATVSGMAVFRPEDDGNREYFTKPDDTTQEYPFLSAADLGTKPTQVPQCWMLGSMAFQGPGITVDSVGFRNDQPYTSGDLGYTSLPTSTNSIDTKSLEHYEQGQFRCYLVNNSGVVVNATQLNSARFTRIGNEVTVYGSFQMTASNLSSIQANGNTDAIVRIPRIPYPAANYGSLKFLGSCSVSNAASGSLLADVTVQVDAAAGNYSDPELCISFTAKKGGNNQDEMLTYSELGQGYVKYSVKYLCDDSTQW